jgi:hypothetical protein
MYSPYAEEVSGPTFFNNYHEIEAAVEADFSVYLRNYLKDVRNDAVNSMTDHILNSIKKDMENGVENTILDNAISNIIDDMLLDDLLDSILDDVIDNAVNDISKNPIYRFLDTWLEVLGGSDNIECILLLGILAILVSIILISYVKKPLKCVILLFRTSLK